MRAGKLPQRGIATHKKKEQKPPLEREMGFYSLLLERNTKIVTVLRWSL
jgi:hypothetical protein